MEFLTILPQFFFILIMAIAFIIGLIMTLIGLLKRSGSKKLIKKGLIFLFLPSVLFIYTFLKDSFLYETKPDEIAGTYKISKSSTIDVSHLEKIRLKLDNDGNFYLNNSIPKVNICQKGKFEYDSEIEDENALSFYCENIISVQGIKRNFTNFKIEFKINKTDNEFIYFEKIN